MADVTVGFVAKKAIIYWICIGVIVTILYSALVPTESKTSMADYAVGIVTLTVTAFLTYRDVKKQREKSLL